MRIACRIASNVDINDAFVIFYLTFDGEKMISRLFSFKHAHTNEPKPQAAKAQTATAKHIGIDEWELHSDSALRIPILSSEVRRRNPIRPANVQASQPSLSQQNITDFIPVLNPEATGNIRALDNSNAFGDKAANSILAQALPPVLTDIVQACSPKIVAIPQVTKTIGIYSDSEHYFDILTSTAETDYPNIKFIWYSGSQQDIQSLKNGNISAWIFRLSDEGEHPFLDHVLDNYEDAETLFLFESKLSKQCIEKFDSFVIENGLANK